MAALLLLALAMQQDVSRLVDALDDDDIEVRDAAQVRLQSMGLRVKEQLTSALAGATGERAARLRAVLDRLPPLELVVRAERDGADVRLTLVLRNVSDKPVWAAWSDSERHRDVRIVDSDGALNLIPDKKITPDHDAPDFHKLAPGEERSVETRMWRPERPGRYEVRATYDGSSDDPADWWGRRRRRVQPEADVLDVLREAWHGKLVSEPLVCEVNGPGIRSRK